MFQMSNQRIRWDYLQEQLLTDIVHGKIAGSEIIPKILIHNETNSRYTREW